MKIGFASKAWVSVFGRNTHQVTTRILPSFGLIWPQLSFTGAFWLLHVTCWKCCSTKLPLHWLSLWSPSSRNHHAIPMKACGFLSWNHMLTNTCKQMAWKPHQYDGYDKALDLSCDEQTGFQGMFQLHHWMCKNSTPVCNTECDLKSKFLQKIWPWKTRVYSKWDLQIIIRITVVYVSQLIPLQHMWLMFMICVQSWPKVTCLHTSFACVGCSSCVATAC
jgi:hypothetical protein